MKINSEKMVAELLDTIIGDAKDLKTAMKTGDVNLQMRSLSSLVRKGNVLKLYLDTFSYLISFTPASESTGEIVDAE